MKAYAVVAGGNSLVGTHDRRNAAIEDARNTARQLNEHVEIRRLNVFGDMYEDVVLVAPAGGGKVSRPEPRKCYCPGDCNCRHQGAPWHRTNYCGCKAHAA